MRHAFALLVFLTLAASPVSPRADTASNRDGERSSSYALIDSTLTFLKRYALDAPDEASLLRAGVVRLCTEKLNRPGCRRPDLQGSGTEMAESDRARAWRAVLESVIEAEKRAGGNDFDAVALQRYAMDAMVNALNDPQSFYIAPAVYRQIGSIPADFIGFGFAPRPEAEGLGVAVVYPESPAYEAGLHSGDLITEVNGRAVSGYRRPMALAAIWGADGELIKLTTKRDNTERIIEIAYHPWTFNPYSVTVRGGVATAQISHLSAGLTDAVSRAISKPGVDALVLDLRDAVTGSQSETLRLGDLLLPKGLFGMRRSASDLAQRRWTTQSGSTGENLTAAVIVILSENTSGWGELFSGALKHHQRALVIGEKSAGNPRMQLIRPFEDGSAIQVTSSELRGPPEVDLASGVRPHVELSSEDPLPFCRKIFGTATDGKVPSLFAAARELVGATKKPSLDSDR